MKIAFYKGSWNWIDKAIRFWTFWKYSHCELILSDWSMFSSSWMDWGVRVKRFYNSKNWDIFHTNVYETWIKKSLMVRELWKGYDYYWLFFNFIVDLDLENKDKWFCSEICWYILWIENPSNYSPNWLYKKLIKDNIIKWNY